MISTKELDAPNMAQMQNTDLPAVVFITGPGGVSISNQTATLSNPFTE
jgi:hypothetical protein